MKRFILAAAVALSLVTLTTGTASATHPGFSFGINNGRSYSGYYPQQRYGSSFGFGGGISNYGYRPYNNYPSYGYQSYGYQSVPYRVYSPYVGPYYNTSSGYGYGYQPYVYTTPGIGFGLTFGNGCR